MASGEVSTVSSVDPESLPLGSVITYSGRVSGVTEPGDVSVHYPFPNVTLAHLDDQLSHASRTSQARFAVYIGDLGSDTATKAREILAKVPTPNDAVLVAVSPDQRAVEVVYGAGLRSRGAESAAPLGVAAATTAFGRGDLIGGLVSAVRAISSEISPA